MLQKVNKFYQFLLTIIIFILHTLDEDYSFMSPQTFLYLRNEPEDKDIDINIINDNVALEPIEVIEISLMVPSDVFGQHTATIIIRDEDSKNAAVMCLLIILCTPLLLSFIQLLSVLTIAASPSFFGVPEGGSISFTVSKDKATAVPVDITITPLTYQQYSNRTAANNNLPSLSSITAAPSNPAEGI